jgi:hypothetical protein
VQQRLKRWRERHGGRGQAIPGALWDAVVEVARADGVESTARALRVDRERLARRVELAPGPGPVSLGVAREVEPPREAGEFVELNAHSFVAPGATVRFEGRDGEKLEVTGACAVDVVEFARAFWSRGR